MRHRIPLRHRPGLIRDTYLIEKPMSEQSPLPADKDDFSRLCTREIRTFDDERVSRKNGREHA